MRSVRTLAVLTITVVLTLAGCGGDDDDSSSSAPDDVAAVDDVSDVSAADDVSDDVGAVEADADLEAGDVDCEAIDPALEVLGLNWVYLQNVAGSGTVDLFDDIAPGGLIPVDFDALSASIDELRVLEPHGENVAELLDRLEETADLARGAIDADEAAQAEAIAAITELTNSGQQMVSDQLDLGLALNAAGC